MKGMDGINKWCCRRCMPGAAVNKTHRDWHVEQHPGHTKLRCSQRFETANYAEEALFVSGDF